MRINGIFVIFLLLFVSCTKDDQVNMPLIRQEIFGTKSVSPTDTIFFRVSERDLMHYIKFRYLEQKKENKVKSTIPVPTKSTFPLAYIINYENGWEMVSADKRTSPRLAYSEVGELDFEQCPDTQKAWLESVMDEIRFLQSLPEEEYLNLGKECLDEMGSNYEFWEAITASDSYLERVLGEGYRGNPGLGYYELDDVIVDTLEYEVVNHLMAVHWHQNAPYNNYCPLRTDDPSRRAFAGCGAIAAAQILWYLHMTYGYPIYAPSSASCVGNVDSYIMTQSGQSSTIWNSMSICGDDAAVLIAKVGTMVGMQYSNTSSISYFSSYAPSVFSPFGVNSSSYSTFNASIAGSNLLDGLPVFVRAATANNVGHFFVIDGYKAYHVGHGLRYIWVSTDPSPDPQTIIEPTLNIYSYYEDPFVSEFSMNWGWGQTYDNGWYTTTGSWAAGGYSFDFGKMMLANFSEN